MVSLGLEEVLLSIWVPCLCESLGNRNISSSTSWASAAIWTPSLGVDAFSLWSWLVYHDMIHKCSEGRSLSTAQTSLLEFLVFFASDVLCTL